ncbi:MAG: hypothetical protein PHS93_00065 [Candidatus Omnitrophica bacterium]|nr:hypothetical protein [Candidatus Omnitrophota bacterium]MDD5351556.1 hypothetical protein [Candidatus Omnitrophota bacterium]MDD5550991.1 hypothetical protein [Candidatus Omnitrophota bacterium]
MNTLNKTILSIWFNTMALITRDKGQMIIEYVVMFSVIVMVIIFAATTFIRPSVNRLFESTSVAINHVAEDFVANAYSW